jgi:hypothetical protein
MSGACQVYYCFKVACNVTDFEAYGLIVGQATGKSNFPQETKL